MSKRKYSKGTKIVGAVVLFGFILGMVSAINVTVDASEVRSHSFSFDRGVDSITYQTQSQEAMEAAMLPERAEAPQQDLNNRRNLEDLLIPPNVENMLSDELRPHLENRDLLTPGKFKEALSEARSQLRERADSLMESGEAQADEARTLNRAARLLQEERQLRELLQTYRSALFQG